MNPNEQYSLCNCSFKVKFGNSNISTENLFNPSKRKGCKGEILAQNLQRAGFEVVKCDKHSRVAFVILVLRRFEILDHCIHLPRNRYKVKLPSLLQLLHQSQLQQISAYWTLQREKSPIRKSVRLLSSATKTNKGKSSRKSLEFLQERLPASEKENNDNIDQPPSQGCF